MANHHFAKLADVWKHLPLAEVLACDRPRHYWESHAGSAEYAMVDDAERRYGARRLVAVAGRDPALAGSRYVAHLTAIGGDGLAVYPGSARLAMAELGAGASYLLCDVDPRSAADLRDSADRLGLAERVRVEEGDGMGVLAAALDAVDEPSTVVAHVDPFDPRTPGPAGLSALDLARRLVDAGAGLVYWYGYDHPARRAWAVDELADGTRGRPLWCGDVRIAACAPPAVRDDGDLGEATTPGTGFGIVCANVSDRAREACVHLGEALRDAYERAPLPDGTPGRLELTWRVVA